MNPEEKMGVECGDGGLRTDDLIRGPDYPELMRAVRRAGVKDMSEIGEDETRCTCDDVLRKTMVARCIT